MTRSQSSECVAPAWASQPHQLSQIAAAVYSRRAMIINYKPGKSEILLAVHGPGSRKMKAELMGRLDHLSSRGVWDRSATTTPISALTSIRMDTTRRICRSKSAKAKTAVQPLAKHVLRDSQISLRDRARIVCVLGLTVATFNSGMWHYLTKSTAQAWTITSIYRCLLPEGRAPGHPEYPDAGVRCRPVFLPFPATLHASGPDNRLHQIQ